jgi:hypothetical protein
MVLCDNWLFAWLIIKRNATAVSEKKEWTWKNQISICIWKFQMTRTRTRKSKIWTSNTTASSCKFVFSDVILTRSVAGMFHFYMRVRQIDIVWFLNFFFWHSNGIILNYLNLLAYFPMHTIKRTLWLDHSIALSDCLLSWNTVHFVKSNGLEPEWAYTTILSFCEQWPYPHWQPTQTQYGQVQPSWMPGSI